MSSTKASVVAVLSGAEWAGATGQLVLSGYLSVPNANTLLNLRFTGGLTSNAISFGVALFKWDPVNKAYYRAFETAGATMGGTLAGLLAVSSTPPAPQLSVSESATQFGDRSVRAFTLSIAAPPTYEYLTIATSVGTTSANQIWGLAAPTPMCTQPLLLGLTVAAARTKLQDNGCGYDVKYITVQTHTRVRHERIVRVSGQAGMTYPLGHVVTIDVEVTE